MVDRIIMQQQRFDCRLLFFAYVIAQTILFAKQAHGASNCSLGGVRIPTDQEIQQHIADGQKYARQYTNPQFLQPLIYPEEFRKQQQRVFNNTLLQKIISEPFSLGIYKQDALLASFLALTWSEEFGMFHYLHKSLIHYYSSASIRYNRTTNLLSTESIESQDASVHLLTQQLSCASFLKHLWTDKKLIVSILAHCTFTAAMQQSYDYLLLNEPIPNQDGKTVSISSLVPNEAKKLLCCAIPTGTIQLLSSFFDKFDLLPDWHNRLDACLIKELIAYLAWFCWYEKYTVRPAFLEYIAQSNNRMFNPSRAASIPVFIEHFFKQTLTRDFASWISQKTVSMTLLHSTIMLSMMTPAFYKAGSWIWRLYKNLKKDTHEKDKGC